MNMHSKFWSLLRKTADYSDQYKEEIKRSWVQEYSAGKTYSLKELHQQNPAAYDQMITALENEVNSLRTEKEIRNNLQRKKLLALIYDFCKYKKYPYTKEKVKALACKICGVKVLNKASEQKLIAAIERFEEFEKLQQEANQAWANEQLDKLSIELELETDMYGQN